MMIAFLLLGGGLVLSPDPQFGGNVLGCGSHSVAGTCAVQFDLSGSNLSDEARFVFRDKEGRYLVVGDVDGSAGSQIGIARLTSNGRLDLTFGLNGKQVVDGGWVRAAHLDSTDRLWIGTYDYGKGITFYSFDVSGDEAVSNLDFPQICGMQYIHDFVGLTTSSDQTEVRAIVQLWQGTSRYGVCVLRADTTSGELVEPPLIISNSSTDVHFAAIRGATDAGFWMYRTCAQYPYCGADTESSAWRSNWYTGAVVDNYVIFPEEDCYKNAGLLGAAIDGQRLTFVLAGGEGSMQGPNVVLATMNDGTEMESVGCHDLHADAALYGFAADPAFPSRIDIFGVTRQDTEENGTTAFGYVRELSLADEGWIAGDHESIGIPGKDGVLRGTQYFAGLVESRGAGATMTPYLVLAGKRTYDFPDADFVVTRLGAPDGPIFGDGLEEASSDNPEP